jgi:hypothetical protein
MATGFRHEADKSSPYHTHSLLKIYINIILASNPVLWSSVLEKKIGLYIPLVKVLSSFTQSKVHYRGHQSPPLVRVRTYTCLGHTPPTNFIKPISTLSPYYAEFGQVFFSVQIFRADIFTNFSPCVLHTPPILFSLCDFCHLIILVLINNYGVRH